MIGEFDGKRRALGVAMVCRAGIGVVSLGVYGPSQARADTIGNFPRAQI